MAVKQTRGGRASVQAAGGGGETTRPVPPVRPKLTNRWTVDERRRQTGSGWAQGAKSYGVSQQ